MDLSQIVPEIIESEHGHSGSDANTGGGGCPYVQIFCEKSIQSCDLKLWI